MSREIKFRAWDEQNKVMHYDVEFIRSGTEGNDWIIFKSDKQKLEDGNVLNNPYFQQQLKLIQFTGLHDKNGKEVYESDIVSAYLPNNFRNKELYEVKIPVLGGYSIFTNLVDIEVIGNIYENKDLLNK